MRPSEACAGQTEALDARIRVSAMQMEDLAQIAAMADRHFRIEKSLQNDAAVTTIRALDRADSIGELARILGGAQITELTRQSAKEMKEMAERTKKY